MMHIPASGPVQARAALLALAVAAAAILGALAFEHLGGLVPCPLCLRQRWPYYLAAPFLLLAVPLAARRLGSARLALLAAGAFFIYGTGLGIYHAGVEWDFWAGPADCAPAGLTAPTSAADLMSSLSTTRIVPCDEAAWRFLGLSLAGYNALVSAGLAGLLLWGAARRA